MMTEELQDFDSMRHASIFSSISTIAIGALESLHDSFNSSFPTIDAVDTLEDSITFPTIDSVDTLEDSITTSGCAAKTVAWAPKTSQQEHISRYQMTYEEARQTWIFEDEKSEMMETTHGGCETPTGGFARGGGNTYLSWIGWCTRWSET